MPVVLVHEFGVFLLLSLHLSQGTSVSNLYLLALTFASMPPAEQFQSDILHIRAPRLILAPSWDLNFILEELTLSPFEPVTSVPLKIMSWKTVFFVAVTLTRIVSELQA